MKSELSEAQKIILRLFREPLIRYNSRNISQEVGISHAGAFKILKKLADKDIVNPERIGRAVVYTLNKENPLSFREVEMALTIEAQEHRIWLEEFKSLENKSEFIILFGSILVNEKNARDIDLLVVANEDKFKEIKDILNERNKILNKKIHLILQEQKDFMLDLNNKKGVIWGAIKKGIVLFGQEKISKMVIK
ncbi:MAG: nucleotidyltransferase domain-containing protein [Nanoarchaeota archaeon]